MTRNNEMAKENLRLSKSIKKILTTERCQSSISQYSSIMSDRSTTPSKPRKQKSLNIAVKKLEHQRIHLENRVRLFFIIIFLENQGRLTQAKVEELK